MLKQTELRILSSFFPEGKERTLKQIMEKSGLSYEPIYRNIQELARKKIISSKRFGKTLVYSLNFEKEEVKTAFFFYAKETLKEFSKKYKIIFNALSKVNDEDVDFLAVFGSYTKGNTGKESDVDVLCVSSTKKENEIFWNDLIKFGIIFKGYELFYSEAYLK